VEAMLSQNLTSQDDEAIMAELEALEQQQQV
jgi:hypothetical protein